MIARALAIFAPVVLVSSVALASDKSDKAAAGTDGTATAYGGDGEVLLVETCDKGDEGDWDYVSCVRELREKVVAQLCKKAGSYKWSFQVGSEKSKLTQSTTCK